MTVDDERTDRWILPPCASPADRDVMRDLLGRPIVGIAARGAYLQARTRGEWARFGVLELVAPSESTRRTNCRACGDEHPDVLLVVASGALCAIWPEVDQEGFPAFRAVRHGERAWMFGGGDLVDRMLGGGDAPQICRVVGVGATTRIVPVSIHAEDEAPIVQIGLEPYAATRAVQVGSTLHAIADRGYAVEPHVVLTVRSDG